MPNLSWVLVGHAASDVSCVLPMMNLVSEDTWESILIALKSIVPCTIQYNHQSGSESQPGQGLNLISNNRRPSASRPQPASAPSM
ncbi:hypothetical protein BO82DRAFT_169267 [Aspergillus uvarum CBS 121591]|uniref:Uncharacterized protein n=1 Tax=Aspergillus uvarum CBS 121591 TaxID=1448315 RepID=A0A319C1C2_9EURO|nr:hypothetical protein BO82DRAFT_169267 [Aspergillus uvarum CBS 121591]PYH77997.1 hypothetical protein BO82DRAFT_169267 [Aspergillus uvarum CBS 121591]